MKKFWMIAIAVVVVLGGGALWAYQRAAGQAAARTGMETVRVTRGDLNTTVGATGTVRAGQSSVVSWGTSGRVDRVNVKVGQVVQEGAVLAELDPSSLSQNVIMAEADLVEARRTLENLNDSEVQKAEAQQVLVSAQEAYDEAERIRSNMGYRRGSDAQIAAANADYILAQDKVDDMQARYDRTLHLPEDNPTRALALTNLEDAKKECDRLLINLNWFKGEATEQEIAEADADLALAAARLADAQREWDRLMNGPDPEDIRAAEVRIAAIEAVLEQARLSAPFAASVTVVDALPGDVVAAGTRAFRLDDLSHLYVDVLVSEVDINRVEPGQEAVLIFDAIQGKEYHGLVSDVALVGEDSGGAVNFNVTVALTDADAAVRPGMTAGVNIVINRKSSVLLVPNRAVSSEDGKRVVWVVRGEAPVKVEVQLGASDELSSEITAGDLEEGDVVVLNPSGTDLQSLPGPGVMFFGGRR